MRNYIVLGVTFALTCTTGSAIAQEGNPRKTTEVIPDHLAYLYSQPQLRAPSKKADHLVARHRRWENGRTLRVCFFSGNPVATHLIRTVASEWTRETGVTLDFGPSDGWYNCLDPNVGFPEIRVSFSERGYWSYVGSDSERYGGERSPSMNLDSFNRIYKEGGKYTVLNVVDKADPDHKSTIRHEFGHALGLLHEHQHPALNCFNQLKRTGPGNIYEVYGGPPNNWSVEQIDRNFQSVEFTDPDYIAYPPDLKSEMMYYISKEDVNNPNSECAGRMNYGLSEKDKKVIATIYPRSSPGKAIPAVSETVASAFVKPVPQFIPHADTDDYAKRIIVDLESEDTAMRRNARVRLSQVLQQNSGTLIDEIIADLKTKSYRYKLGVAVALANADKPIEASNAAMQTIAEQAKRTVDATLKKNFQLAQRKLERR